MKQQRTPLPIIVGSGGISPAGRVSFNHAYRRMVIDSLPEPKRAATLSSLAKLMGLARAGHPDLDKATTQQILDGTLVRKIEHFDVEHVAWNSAMSLGNVGDGEQTFVVAKRQLPQTLPEGWLVVPDVRIFDVVGIEVTTFVGGTVLLFQIFGFPITKTGNRKQR